MRIENSIKNIYINIISQVIITLLGFVSRKLFIDNLGTEYLGINGLLTNVLSMLSLVEGGIGVSITYNLYKPLAEKDTLKIIALVQLYKKIYSVLACIVLILSFILYPFLGMIINSGENIENIGIVYFIFVIKNVISYLNAHKWSLINADQRGYILARYNLLFNIITTICKIAVLLITRNYILFLTIEVAIFIAQNLWNGNIVNREYPYIKTKKKYKVNDEIKSNLIKNVKALFLHNIGTYCVYGTDNILISYFINIRTVGLYSNYTIIVSQLSSLLTPILNGVGASVGNMLVTESKEKSYEIFNIIYFVNFWIYSFCGIVLYNLVEEFINMIFGTGLLLDKLTFLVIIINFYVSGLRESIHIFKCRAGIFSPDKYVPIIESIVNLGASIILVKYFGLAGIFMGTTISTITIPLWIQAKLVYNDVFKISVRKYFEKYIYYLIVTIIIGVFTTLCCKYIHISNSFVRFIVKSIICVVIPNVFYAIVFCKTEEFKYILNLIKSMISKINIYKSSFGFNK